MFFPMFVDLTNINILVVGGGTIASRRISTLVRFAECITVVAPEVTEQVEMLWKTQRIHLKKKPFELSDLEDAQLVLAATSDMELNKKIYEICKNRKIPVNNCSDQNQCDFQFPSIVEKDGLVIGINSSGKDHKKVKDTRIKLEHIFNNDERRRIL